MTNIENIKFFKKKTIRNPKGNILHYINKNNKNYIKFGEVYFSWIKKNQTKGWKLHKKMHMNLAVPVGNVRFIFFDEKLKKKYIFNINKKNFGTLYVPPKIWFSFKNMDKKKDSLVINFSNIVHDKKESINQDLNRF